jgi:hypothetical protein
MAITVANKTVGADDRLAGLNDDLVTASVAFQNSRLYIISWTIRGGTTPDVGSVTGGGITWTKTTATRTTAPFMAQYWGLTTSGASTGALTGGSVSGNPTGVKWTIDEFAGINTASPIVQTAAITGGSNGSLNITLSAFADSTNNAAYGVSMTNTTDGSVTVDGSGGWTLLGFDNSVISGTQTIMSEYKIGQDTNVTCTWPGAGANQWVGNALEIAVATAAATRKLRTVSSPLRW